jgi:hypothetical protein
MMRRALIISCTSLLLLAFTGVSVNYAVTRDVISGGAQTANSTSYAFTATLGQPNVGTGSSSSYDICHGFWCELAAVIPPTGPTIVPIGPAILIYRFTFDHIGIAALALLLLVLFLARQTYNRTRQIWGAT